MSKPKVSDMTWRRIYHSQNIEAFEADEDDMYFKVEIRDARPKYFYGETAHMDYQRYVMDNQVSW